jgi:aryl-alcohol dehydrogenase-like predicted oxidoreductase
MSVHAPLMFVKRAVRPRFREFSMSKVPVIPGVSLGATGRIVSRAGLGGEGILRTRGKESEAVAVIESALAAGFGYFDTARVYDDSERYYGKIWGRRPAAREGVFQTSKCAERAAGPARRQLEETLRRLAVDHLDLWQIHDVRTFDDLDELQAPGGALEAFLGAREAGLVRHIGITGHHDPAVLTLAVETLPVEVVLLPINPMEALLGGFLDLTVGAARARGIGVVGMKALGGAGGFGGAGGGRLVQAGYAAEELLRFAFAQDIDVLIVGCASAHEVALLAECASAPKMAAAEQQALLERMHSQAGRYATYRGNWQAPC